MALVTTDFNINITPGAMPPVVHVSEYDIGRSYTVGLIGENDDAFTIPAETTATIEGTLNGAVGFSVPATIDDNKVAFTLTESMTAYAGKAWCKVKLTLNGEPIQTCAFVLAVDRAGVEAETVIGAPGFEEQINQGVSDWANDNPESIDRAVAAYFDDNPPPIPGQLPNVTAADNGKVLGVVNGAWAVKSDEGGSSVTVDSALSDTSENPVQNKVVKAALDERDGWMQKCRLVSDTSPNMWNPDTVQIGLLDFSGRVYTGGSFDNYCYNDSIAVEEGDVLAAYDIRYPPNVRVENMARVVAYDSNGDALPNITASNVTTYTVPAGVAGVKVVASVGVINYQFMVLKNAEAAPTEYIPYGTGATYYVATEDFLPKTVFDPVINLPSELYALVGYELNVYFENLVEDWTQYDWNVDCSKGMQLERGYRITPTADDVGDYTLSIVVSNGKDSATFSTTLHVIAASANSGVTKTVMVLGDSTTNNGIAVTKLNENFANDVMNITLVGTRGTAPNLHEGRSGWRFSSYFNPPNAGDIASGVENPWYNPTTQTFDASYYFAETGIAKPDWFFINLGINDVFVYADDTALNAQIETCKSLCDDMIASIKSASPSTKIGLCLTIPPNHSQDAFGKAYKCGQTRDRYKRNNLLWVHSLIETYSNRASNGIYLIPIYTNLDTVYNMGLETMPVNSRNTEITYQSPIGNGGVHPVSSGYWQIADVYTAFLKSQA